MQRHLSYIYLGYFVCLFVIVCVCVTIAERTAILLVLVIKLTKETRRRAWRGRDTDGEIGKGQIGEGGNDETLLCLKALTDQFGRGSRVVSFDPYS